MPHTVSRHHSALIVLALVSLSLSVFPLLAQGTGSTELRVGILPDADSLPLMVAESSELFQAEGVRVRLVRFQNPVERDAAFQSGAVDGIIGDIIGAALAVQGGFQVRITSLTDGRYGIVVGPDSPARNLQDLAGKSIGLSSNTIIQYMVDSFMTAAGVPASRIQGLPVPRMPVRLEMMLAGQTAGAGLPEPLLTVARIRGGRVLAATDDRGLKAGVLLFSLTALETKMPQIKSMYRAYWKAAQNINAGPDTYRPFLVDKAGFPAEAAAVYRFVRYEKPRMPSDPDIAQVLAWMREKNLLRETLSPASLLDGRALSGW